MEKVPVWVVTYSRRSRLHLDPACTGLGEDRDLDELTMLEVDRPRELALDSDRLPCRICALGAVLTDLIADPLPGTPEWVSVASVPLQRLGDGSAEVSDTGAQRLHTVADAVSWPVFTTPVGPVMVGLTTMAVAQLIEENLATLRTAASTTRPFDLSGDVDLAEVLAGAWSLARSRPAHSTDADVITLAAALAA